MNAQPDDFSDEMVLDLHEALAKVETADTLLHDAMKRIQARLYSFHLAKDPVTQERWRHIQELLKLKQIPGVISAEEFRTRFMHAAPLGWL